MKKKLFWSAAGLVVLALGILVWMGGGEHGADGGSPRPGAGTPERPLAVRADDTPVEVLDISERTLDNHPALAVIFATPLDAERDYQDFLHVTSDGKAVDGAWVLSDSRRILYFPHIQPQRSYTVRVRRGLTAANGSQLVRAMEVKVTTRKITPAAGFASQGSVLPGAISEGLPIMTVNVPEVDIQFLRVKPDKLATFLNAYYHGQRSYGYYELNRMTSFTESVYLARFTTEAKPDTRTITHIPVQDIDELRTPGLYIAIMSLPGKFTYSYNTTFFVTSDLGLHTRVYADSMDVYMSSLNSGKALADVRVELLDGKGKLIEKVFTDAAGRAVFRGRPEKDQVLVARQDDNLAILSFQQSALDLSEFPVTGAPQNDLEVFVYSSRDLYRPGESVDLSLLLRDGDGRSVTAQPLSLSLKRPDGQVASRFTLRPEALGYYQHMLPISADAPTGKWSLEVRTAPGSEEPVQTWLFNVEEFLPERMKLVLESAREFLSAEEDFIIDVSGAYLYGAPAAGNRFTAALAVAPAHHPLEKFKEYYFGDVQEDNQARYRELLDTKLDAQGELQITVRPLESRLNTPMRVRVTGSVFESGGRPVTRSISRIVWPAEAVLGIRPRFSGEYAESYSTAEFEVIRTGPDGKLLAASDLEVRVIREDRDYYWTFDDNRGWHYEYSEAQYPVLTQELTFRADQRGTIRVPVEYGAYRIEISDADTGLVARYRFFAGWNWASRDTARSARPDKVKLVLDKPAYGKGDSLHVTVTPPHAGEGMILIESDRLLWSRRVSIPAEGLTLDIPLAEEWLKRHDLYVSAVVFRPGKARDRATPNRAIGVAPIPLDRSARRLEVNLELPTRMRPQNDLAVRIKVPGLAQQQAMVTVSAVDVGILNITNYATPDPWGHFFARRRYGIEAYDIYQRIIENLAGVRARLRFGGDAPLERAGPQRSKRADARVKTVALFSGPLKLDANGEALVKLPIPNFNGSLRVMAVAFSTDRFGSGEAEVTVAAPVVAEIATPRFLSPGDRSLVTVDVHNLSGKARKLKLKLTASAPLRLEPVTRTLSLGDGKKTTLRFDLSAARDFGVGTIRLELKGDDIDIAREWELGVRPAWPAETRRLRFRLETDEEWVLPPALIAGLMPDTVDATLVVSNLPPLNIRDAVQGLLRYPYGCLEQTTSSAFPLVYVDADSARRLGLKPLSLSERAKRLDVAFKRIQSMQLPSGGFGLWSANSIEELWLTPYAADFLLEAREKGFDVPPQMLQRALENLLRRLQSGNTQLGTRYYTQSPGHFRFAAQAYAAYVLARVQRAPLGTLRTLFDHHRKDAESGLPLVHLGIALRLAGDQRRGDTAIAEGLKKARTAHRYLGDYGSPIRDLALTLALLDRHGIETAERAQLLFALADEIRSRRYFSTQERLALFLAGRDLDRHAGEPWQAVLREGEARRELGEAGRLVLPLDAGHWRTGLRLQSRNASPLFAELVVNGYTIKAPAPVQGTVRINRAIYDLKGRLVDQRTLRVGELLLVHLQASTDERIEDALVVDLLPAGLEVENLNLSQGTTLDELRINGVDPRAAMSADLIKHSEYRDDRFVAAVSLQRWRSTDLFYLVRVVSPGTYTVPPPYLEDMYRPEIRAIGISGKPLHIVNEAE